jgi:release factor glutamine methyltransferase
MRIARRAESSEAGSAPGDAAVARPPTIIEVLQPAADYLARNGIESPRLNAELLLAWVLGCSRLDLYLRFDERLSDEHRTRYRLGLKQRAGHRPLQLITGEVEFFSLPFRTREGVFIPRPETELLVERIEELLGDVPEVRYIEMGVGAGVISATLAARRTAWRGLAFDLSADAARLARANALALGVTDRLGICASDGFGSFAPRAVFDLVVSNPPYIPTADIDGLPDEISRFEARNALDGGVDGMRFYPLLARAGEALLRDGGLLAVEIGAGQGDRVGRIVRDAGYESIEVRRDYNGIERVVTAFRARAGRGGDDG